MSDAPTFGRYTEIPYDKIWDKYGLSAERASPQIFQ